MTVNIRSIFVNIRSTVSNEYYEYLPTVINEYYSPELNYADNGIVIYASYRSRSSLKSVSALCELANHCKCM